MHFLVPRLQKCFNIVSNQNTRSHTYTIPTSSRSSQLPHDILRRNYTNSQRLVLNDGEHSEDTRSETQSFERSEQSTPELRPVENREKPLVDYIQLPLHTRRVATI